MSFKILLPIVYNILQTKLEKVDVSIKILSISGKREEEKELLKRRGAFGCHCFPEKKNAKAHILIL